MVYQNKRFHSSGDAIWWPLCAMYNIVKDSAAIWTNSLSGDCLFRRLLFFAGSSSRIANSWIFNTHKHTLHNERHSQTKATYSCLFVCPLYIYNCNFLYYYIVTELVVLNRIWCNPSSWWCQHCNTRVELICNATTTTVWCYIIIISSSRDIFSPVVTWCYDPLMQQQQPQMM